MFNLKICLFKLKKYCNVFSHVNIFFSQYWIALNLFCIYVTLFWISETDWKCAILIKKIKKSQGDGWMLSPMLWSILKLKAL